MPINFGFFSNDQVDKWTVITHDRLLQLGFTYNEKSVFSGKSEYVKDIYVIPIIEDIGDRYVFDANSNSIRDFKFMLSAKHCSSIFDIKQYILHSKYFD